METNQPRKSFQRGSLEAVQQPAPLCWGWEAEKGCGLLLISLLPPPCQVRHPAPSPWHFGVF